MEILFPKKIRKFRHAGLISILGLIGLVAPAQAANPVSLKVAPLFYDLSIGPGEAKDVEISVQNASDSGLKINTEFSDFFVDDAGNYIFSDGKEILNEELKPYLTKGWFSAPEKQFFLEKGQSKTVKVSLSVPQNAVLGGHYGAVFFRTICEFPGDESVISTDKSTLCVSARPGVLFLLQVGGEARKTASLGRMNVPGLSFRDAADFSVEIKNTGNSHFRPEGYLSVKSLIGDVEIEHLEIKDKTILPTRALNTSGKISRKDWWGLYKLSGEVKDGDGNVLRLEKRVFLVPWKEILIIFGLIVGWAWVLKKYRIGKK